MHKIFDFKPKPAKLLHSKDCNQIVQNAKKYVHKRSLCEMKKMYINGVKTKWCEIQKPIQSVVVHLLQPDYNLFGCASFYNH